jgi:exonuclease III
MLTIMFWNVGKKNLGQVVAELAEEHRVDILILTECPDKLDIMRALNPLNHAQFEYCPSYAETRLDIFTRFSKKFVKPILDAPSKYMTMRRITLPERPEFTLTAVHLASKLRTTEQDQHSEAIDHATQIRDTESDHDTNTIVIGDFNMNPFEYGIVDASGFHAVMDRTTALQESRTVKGQEYPFFYNPMWNYLGDISDFTPGTYFYREGNKVVYFWNMFDQVLLRPALLPYFADDSVRIIMKYGTTSLLDSSDRPDRKQFSDHLPILLTLNF